VDEDRIPTRHWYAVHTRSRHEKDVTDELEKIPVDYYLPVTERERRWKDRRKKMEVPLFPGYVFVREDFSGEEGWLRKMHVLKARGAVKILSTPDGDPIPVPDQEIYNVRTVLEKQLKVDPYHYDFYPGQPLRIRKGPLQGVEGILIERKGIHLLILQVHLLCQAVAVTLPAADVEAAG